MGGGIGRGATSLDFFFGAPTHAVRINELMTELVNTQDDL